MLPQKNLKRIQKNQESDTSPRPARRRASRGLVHAFNHLFICLFIHLFDEAAGEPMRSQMIYRDEAEGQPMRSHAVSYLTKLEWSPCGP